MSPLLRLIHRRADLTIVTNEPLRQIVEGHGGRAFVLPDRIPALNHAALEPAVEKREGQVVFICSFAEDEPYEEVIKAGAILEEGMLLHITGSPHRLREGVLRNLPANVRLTGFLPENDYLDLLRRADVLMDLTTREDCLVCGAYEAVALGKPLVLSDTRALRNHFREERCLCGMIVGRWRRVSPRPGAGATS
jgi:glycosyltransferase involved in cell wall biosynthesis